MNTFQPHDYQRLVIEFIKTRPRAGVVMSMGLGKTPTTIKALEEIGTPGHVLVMAPLNIVRSTWGDEIDKWGFDVCHRSLIVNERGNQFPSRAKRLQRYAELYKAPPTMWFINSDLIDDLVDYCLNRYTSHMMPAMLEALAPRVSPELHAKLVKDFAGRDDQDVVADMVKYLESLPAKAQAARERTEQVKAKPSVKKPAVAASQRALDAAEQLLVGLDSSLIWHVRRFPNQWAKTADWPLKPEIWPFPTVVIDESQGIKNHSSEKFKALRKVSPNTGRVIELSGTPSPNSLLDLWSQAWMLDHGKALGESFFDFRDEFFDPDRYIDSRPVYQGRNPKPGAEQEIHRKLEHLMISVRGDVARVPFTVTDVPVHLSEDELGTYRDFAKELVLTVTDDDGGVHDVVAANAAVLAAKLTQYASGTMYVTPTHCKTCGEPIKAVLTAESLKLLEQFEAAGSDDDDDSALPLEYETVHVTAPADGHEPTLGRRQESFVELHSKKIEMLDHILREENSPTIVCYRFVSDRIRLERELRKLGHDVVVFNGRPEMIREWNAGNYPVMLLQPASAGHGLNLQHGGHVMVWYTLPWSMEHYEQANARLARQGQTETVRIYRLIAQKTYDTRYPAILEGKANVQGAFMDHITREVADATPDIDRSNQ